MSAFTRLTTGLCIIACGTLLTSISMLSTLHEPSLISGQPESITESDVQAPLSRALSDITERLFRNRQSLQILRDRLDRMKFRRNATEGAPEPQNVGQKRHLLDALQLEHGMMRMPNHSENKEWMKIDNDDRFDGSVNTYSSLPLFGCNDIENSHRLRYVGAGYTKIVESVLINSTKVALKHPAVGGKDMVHCIESGTSRKDCWTLASYKVLKEATLMQQLNHPGISKLLGYCIKGDVDDSMHFPDLSLVTELGEPLDLIRLVQTSWEDRLRIILDLTRLLVYLANSPLGPLVIYDFKPTQFVLVAGQLKLSDLDDVGTAIAPPKCSAGNEQCKLDVSVLGGTMANLTCTRAEDCPDYADRINLILAWQNFYSLQLTGGPPWLQNELELFLNQTRFGAISSRDALNLLDRVVALCRAGKPDGHRLKKHSYNEFRDMDLPGRFDYWCKNSYSAQTNSCVFSVTDEKEAQYICSLDDNCRAFILTNQTTWTGRYLVYLKSGFDHPVHKPGCRMFVRVS